MKNKKHLLYRISVFLMDAVCMFLAIWIILTFYSKSANLVISHNDFGLLATIYLTLAATMLLVFRCYSDSIRDYTIYNVLKIAGAILSAHLVFAVIATLIGQPLPFTLHLSLFIYSIGFFGAYRLIILTVKHVRTRMLKPADAGEMKRVIIVGAGDAGRHVVSMLNHDRTKRLRPVAFIDDDPNLEGNKIRGLPVVGPRMLIPYAAKKYKAETIIIAIPFVDNSTIREIFNLCCEANCTVKRFGSMTNLAFEGLAKSTINEVRVEDLLQRDVVRLDLESIYGLINKKVVLVTGGAGSIGSELCKQILNYGAQLLIILDRNENGLFDIAMDLKQKYSETTFEICVGSIRDKDMMDYVFNKYKPNIVFHAAAFKHVPVMEANMREAIDNNIRGTKNIIDVSIAHHVERFILISSDKAVNPSNIMGATKRVAELMIQEANKINQTIFAAVRFGNVLGSNSSVVPIFQKQIRAGGPLTVTHSDVTRYFMTIPEAVQLVLDAASFTKGGEIFVLEMGEPIRIYDLANTMIKLAGLEPGKDIEIKVTGLRPGEKLFEELSLSDETVAKTSSDKIFIFKAGNEMTSEQIQASIDQLIEYAVKKEFALAFEQMKILIPSFKNDFVS